MDEKESRYWLESYQDSCAIQAQMPDSLLVNLADREGDIYEGFVEYQDYAPNELFARRRTDAIKVRRTTRRSGCSRPWRKRPPWATPK